MDTDLSLEQLIAAQDHLNVLRYVRIHQLRQPETVLAAGRALLGGNELDGGHRLDAAVRLAALEQIAAAALDVSDTACANACLTRLREHGVDKESTRFRLLLARCLECAQDPAGAELIYQELLQENPANNLALKRQYCLLKAAPDRQVEAAGALNAYLQQNYADPAAWYELAQLKRELGDWKGAAHCLEEVLLATPASATVHCELAEACATAASGNLEELRTARKHMAQALELEPALVRAQFGLVVVSNLYLQEAASHGNSKSMDEFEVEVAQELVKFGVERVVATYSKGSSSSPMWESVRALMAEYKEGL